MKQYFVLSDTHSFFTAMKRALDHKGFRENNPNHIVILCGDMLDRGEETVECVNFFYDLHKAGRLIFIRGNHEDLFQELMSRGYPEWNDYSNGTVLSYADLFKDFNKREFTLYQDKFSLSCVTPKWKELLASAVNYYEGKNYVFVHGWIPAPEPGVDWRNASEHAWYEARWDNGMEQAALGEKFRVPGKTVVCGHWHASYGNVRKMWPTVKKVSYKELEFSKDISKEKLMKPYYGEGIIAIDACTAWSGFCNCLKISENQL